MSANSKNADSISLMIFARRREFSSSDVARVSLIISILQLVFLDSLNIFRILKAYTRSSNDSFFETDERSPQVA
jgi:hypothetical protein